MAMAMANSHSSFYADNPNEIFRYLLKVRNVTLSFEIHLQSIQYIHISLDRFHFSSIV